jgi:PGF-pre-PGF domain-containing protein
MSRKIFPVLVLLLFVFSAAGFPSVPMNVYGYVTEEGEDVQDRRMEFRYNGSVVHSVSTDSNGFYDAYVPNSVEYSGETVRIFIGDANPENFTYQQGSSKNIDMSGDFRPPDIDDVEVSEVYNHSAVVEWETDENATSLVEYSDEKDDLDNSVEEDTVNLTKEHWINLTDLNDDTEYYYRVVSEDVSGNRRVADDDGDLYSFKTEGGDDGDEEESQQQQQEQGQQGAGNLPSENFGSKDVIASLQNGEASAVATNVSGSMNVNLLPDSDSQSLESVNIDISGDLEEMSVDVESLDERPEAVPEAGTVYRYQSVTTSASDEEVSGATISFRVRKSWLGQRNATLDEVVLKRYTDQWDELETEYLEEDGDFYRFEAETPGFSFFAVSIKELQESGTVDFDNISLEPQEGEAPLNVTVQGQLVNKGLSGASKTVDLYLDGEKEMNRTYELEGGERRNFSFGIVIDEPGVHTLEVGDRAFTVNAEDPSGSPLPLIAGLLLLLLSFGTAGYLQYSGMIDFEEMLLENVGGEEERIEVEDGRFTFKAGDSDEDSQEMEGHVDIELDLSRDEPTVMEKRVYSQAGRKMDMNWGEKLQEAASEHEEELSRRVRNFVHEVKEQNSDGFICSICMDEFDTEDGLHMHQSLTHDIECGVCGEKFETVRGLHIHQGMTHGEISHDLFQD